LFFKVTATIQNRAGAPGGQDHRGTEAKKGAEKNHHDQNALAWFPGKPTGLELSPCGDDSRDDPDQNQNQDKGRAAHDRGFSGINSATCSQ